MKFDEKDKRYIELLDRLKRSGHSNMNAAIPLLQEDFGLNATEAKKVYSYWLSLGGKR